MQIVRVVAPQDSDTTRGHDRSADAGFGSPEVLKTRAGVHTRSSLSRARRSCHQRIAAEVLSNS